MKKLITIILLTAALCISAMPAVFAADTVTAADVEAVMAKHSLVNNEAFKEYRQKHFKDVYKVIPEESYMMYSISLYTKDGPVSELKDADAETASIADIAADSMKDFGSVPYIYRSSINKYSSGEVYIYSDGKTGSGLLSGMRPITPERQFFFNAEDVARVINDNNIPIPKDIMYIENSVEDDYDSDIIVHEPVVLIVTDSGEYVVLHMEYENDVLTHYLVIDGKSYIRYLQGDKANLIETGYNNLTVKTPERFSDVSNDSAVDLLTRMNIINGYGDGTFGGDRYVTRAEAAVMIAKMLEQNEAYMKMYTGVEYENMFSDVPDCHWAMPYIQYGYLSDYIVGSGIGEDSVVPKEYIEDYIPYGEGNTYAIRRERYIDKYTFRPDDTITEQELAKMLVCIADDFGEKMANAEGGWPDGYVSVAKRLGICDNAEDKPATRLTAAHMIKNTLDAQVTKSYRGNEISYTTDRHVSASETIYKKEAFYNLDSMANRVRLKGTMTDGAREKEVKFVVGEDVSSYIGDYKKGEELTLLVQYDDVRNYVNHDCTVYCEWLDGNLTVVMAE